MLPASQFSLLSSVRAKRSLRWAGGLAAIAAAGAFLVANVRVFPRSSGIDAQATQVITERDALDIVANVESGKDLNVSCQEITTAAARIVAHHKGVVTIRGLSSISPSVAHELAGLPAKSSLFLCGLESLSLEAARELVRCKCWVLSFEDLGDVSPALAAVLATYGGSSPEGSSLRLYGSLQMSPDAVKELSRSNALVLDIRGLRQLDDHGAAALAEFRGRALVLNGVEWLSEPACEALSRFQGRLLSLSAIRELTPAAARSLARFQGDSIYLHGLIDPSRDVVALLREFRGKAWLPEGNGVDPENAASNAEPSDGVGAQRNLAD
jgi:hypothetical protein